MEISNDIRSVYFNKTRNTEATQREDTSIRVHQVNSATDIKYIFNNSKSFYIWNPSRNIVYVKEDLFFAHKSEVISTIKSLGVYEHVDICDISDLFK